MRRRLSDQVSVMCDKMIREIDSARSWRPPSRFKRFCRMIGMVSMTPRNSMREIAEITLRRIGTMLAITAIAAIFALLLASCKQCDPKYDFVRSKYERQVSEIELEDSIKGVTLEVKGPQRHWLMAIIDWIKKK